MLGSQLESGVTGSFLSCQEGLFTDLGLDQVGQVSEKEQPWGEQGEKLPGRDIYAKFLGQETERIRIRRC